MLNRGVFLQKTFRPSPQKKRRNEAFASPVSAFSARSFVDATRSQSRRRNLKYNNGSGTHYSSRSVRRSTVAANRSVSKREIGVFPLPSSTRFLRLKKNRDAFQASRNIALARLNVERTFKRQSVVQSAVERPVATSNSSTAGISIASDAKKYAAATEMKTSAGFPSKKLVAA